MIYRIFLTILLLGNSGVFAQELEIDPTYGGLKPIPELSPGQKKNMESIQKDIDLLHKDIGKRLTFLSQEKKLSDGKYVQASYSRVQYEYPTKNRYIVNHQFVLGVTGGGSEYNLNSVELLTRKSRTTKYMEQPYTQIMQIKNKAGDADWSGFQISIKKISPSGEVLKEFPLKDVYEPLQRVGLAKLYRTKLHEIITSIDRYIDAKGKGLVEDIRFIKDEMNTSGQYQEY
ncbi:hypothetical protein [Leptospira sp. GIMC2001]|uniref:hypothetical protein n=1 Tax=Leptospira sp. GIMC2001 TaxID=1513297 RepID=UPI002349EAB9|nr:hypothetical protein [Leptospira sp. GIMC2001]WCL48797.1 hypothetical protein O4O04_16035 [Leptospira sp. GIMC2001]